MKKLAFILSTLFFSPFFAQSEIVEMPLLNFTPSLYPSNEGFNSFMADLYEDGKVTKSVHLWVADDDLLSFYYLVPVTEEPSYEDIISYNMLLESHDVGNKEIYVPLNLQYIATQLGFTIEEPIIEIVDGTEVQKIDLEMLEGEESDALDEGEETDGTMSYHDAYWEARASGKGMQESAEIARQYLRSQGIWDY